ncbi:MAG TPA: hypothetical protein VFM65_09435 [Flavobacteriaceae bacterium]|nr:hypothetical protein [Flavobacteriaceae bacterium]
MRKILLFFALIGLSNSYGQNIKTEEINYFNVQQPKQVLEKSVRAYQVLVETPYTLTAEEVKAQSLRDFETEKANYTQLVNDSKAEYEKLLANHDEAVRQAEENYKLKMAEFNKLSLLERLALTEQGKKPELHVPKKPVYIQPREPFYEEPNLDEYLIFDDQVLADNMKLSGFEKGDDGLKFVIKVSKMEFQDNGGKTFYKQPTTLKIWKETELLQEKTFDGEFQFLTNSASNSIDLDRYEKGNVNKIMVEIEKYINDEFGYIPVAAKITIAYPKNNRREYDALEKVKIKAVSAYRKLNKGATLQTWERVGTELGEVQGIWRSELAKADYNEKKARINKEVAKMIFFNLLRVQISLKNKKQAEATLSKMQDKLLDLELSNRERDELTQLEEKIYKL